MTRDECILRYDPWAGDRDCDVTTFSDRMVVTRKSATCAICFEAIPSGSRIRAQTQRDNDEQVVKTFRFCAPCCDAMARAHDDAGEAIERRTEIGMGRVRREDAVTT